MLPQLILPEKMAQHLLKGVVSLYCQVVGTRHTGNAVKLQRARDRVEN